MTAIICLPGCVCGRHVSRPCSDEKRAKLSAAAKQRKPRSCLPETREKLVALKTKYIIGSVWGRKEVLSRVGRNQWGQPLLYVSLHILQA